MIDDDAPCNGSCDIALARRQVGPDGDVPGNARECAEMWEREATRLRRERDEARAELLAERDLSEGRRLVCVEASALRDEIVAFCGSNDPGLRGQAQSTMVLLRAILKSVDLSMSLTRRHGDVVAERDAAVAATRLTADERAAIDWAAAFIGDFGSDTAKAALAIAVIDRLLAAARGAK